MSWCPKIGRLASSLVYPCHFTTRSLSISSSLEIVGKPSQTTFRETYLGCCVGKGHLSLVCLPSFLFCFVFCFLFFLNIFYYKYLPLVRLTLMPCICLLLTTKARPKLKSTYKNYVKNATEYASTIDDFDKLIDPGCWLVISWVLNLPPKFYVQ